MKNRLGEEYSQCCQHHAADDAQAHCSMYSLAEFSFFSRSEISGHKYVGADGKPYKQI